MPVCMRADTVTPILKKNPQLDPERLQNYRSISNLSFLSKLTERVVAEHLIEHLQRSEIYEPLKSAYWTYTSCETALRKVQDLSLIHI